MSVASSTSSSAGSSVGGWVRRGGLALVMIGALSVSVRGQVEAVEPLLGGMAVILALTNDLAALLALNELMSTRRREVRRWAWAVLVLAGGTAAGLNTWHALEAATLPALWAVVVGIGPVLLAVVLSHLVALVLSDDPPATGAPAAPPIAPPAPAPTPEQHLPARAVPTPALGGSGAHHGLSVVPAPPALPVGGSGDARTAVGQAPADRGGQEEVDPRVEQLAAQLHDGADLTGASVAEQLGCSPRTGRRLLRLAEEHAGSSPTPSRSARERGTG